MESTRIPTTEQNQYAAVCDVYRLYRDLRLDTKYYGRRLQVIRRWSMGIEIAIAISTSATIGSLALLQGKLVLSIFALIAAVLAVLKPILDFPARTDRCSRLWSSYMLLFSSIGRLVRDI